MSKKAILIITDGIGYSEKHLRNAFEDANKPTYERLFNEVPNALIDTYGLRVGLPDGQMGNSEVGHMTIGSGRVLYQDLVKISKALDDGSMALNPTLTSMLDSHERIHLVGLMSDGGVHSHIEHILGLAKLAKSQAKRVFLHLITDGRDVSPTSAPSYIEMVKAVCDEDIQIATMSGRFYAMDRDQRWERVEPAFNAMVHAAPKTAQDAAAYIAASYANDVTDEFVVPTAFEGYEGMQDGDGVIICNFRSDRVREITTALGDASFDAFSHTKPALDIATMTMYDQSFAYDVLFEKEIPKETLAEVVSNAGLRQLHTAETEKYAHVTFFINGGIDEPFLNESRILIPSPKVKTYDEKPQMSAKEVGDAVLTAIDESYDLIIVNFANGDMVGHTGNYDAAIIGVEEVDQELGRIWKRAKAAEYNIVLTSDHGNCEQMIDEDDNVLTNHTVGQVWCFVDAPDVTAVQDGGALNNVAPTVLKLMQLPIPDVMDEPLV